MKTIGIVFAMVAACLASNAFAQEDNEAKRENFVFGIGAGWGNAGADLTIVEEVDRENGIVGNLNLGWAVRNDLVFGVDFDIWSQISGDAQWIFNLSSAALTYLPFDQGVYVSGGVGLGTSRIEVVGSEKITHQDQAGLGYFIGGGYEWRVHEEIALGPQIRWAYFDVNSDVTKSADYFSITVQMTWYKPKN